MLDEHSHLFEYMVLHYSHRVAEPSCATIGWSEEELTALADSFDLETKLRALLGCEHPICDRFLRHHAQEILDNIFETEDEDLFCDSTRKQIATAIVNRRCKPLFDTRTGELDPQLRECIAETLRIARGEARQ